MAIEIDEYAEVRAEKENLIDSKFLGNHPTIKNKNGKAYYDIQNRQWHFIYEDEDYRVQGKNLSCNVDSGFIKAKYNGTNTLAGVGSIGRAKYDEDEQSWLFQPKASKDLFRVQETSLEFLRG